MRLYLLLAVSLFGIATLTARPSIAEEAKDEAAAEQADKEPAPNGDEKPAAPADQAPDAQPQEEDREKADQPNGQQPAAAEPNGQPRRSRVPKHAATPNPTAQPTPRSILTEQQMFVPEAIHRQAVPKAQPKQPANPQALPARRKPNPPFWSPRRGGLSPSATFRLESMGNHVHLSPALRWHLNRSARTPNNQPTNRVSDAATVPGQGAEKFYPGVSRLPQQKPFANLERPATGLQSYWPLLLEGREDPNTGLIIWSLP